MDILLNQKPQNCIMNANICGRIKICQNLHLLCWTKLTAIFVGTKCDGPSFLLCRSHSSFNFASSVASMLRILALKYKSKLLKWCCLERSVLFNFGSKTLWQDQNTGCKKELKCIWRRIQEDCDFLVTSDISVTEFPLVNAAGKCFCSKTYLNFRHHTSSI